EVSVTEPLSVTLALPLAITEPPPLQPPLGRDTRGHRGDEVLGIATATRSSGSPRRRGLRGHRGNEAFAVTTATRPSLSLWLRGPRGHPGDEALGVIVATRPWLSPWRRGLAVTAATKSSGDRSDEALGEVLTITVAMRPPE
ncbi:unnamed protein product, partial [Lampetra fluviatilis]